MLTRGIYLSFWVWLSGDSSRSQLLNIRSNPGMILARLRKSFHPWITLKQRTQIHKSLTFHLLSIIHPGSTASKFPTKIPFRHSPHFNLPLKLLTLSFHPNLNTFLIIHHTILIPNFLLPPPLEIITQVPKPTISFRQPIEHDFTALFNSPTSCGPTIGAILLWTLPYFFRASVRALVHSSWAVPAEADAVDLAMIAGEQCYFESAHFGVVNLVLFLDWVWLSSHVCTQ